MRLRILGAVLISLAVHAGAEAATKPAAKPLGASTEYVGAKACQSCHQEQTQQWLESDHFKAMAEASADTVLGDFSGLVVDFKGDKNRFYKKEEAFYVDTMGLSGKTEAFKVLYTFGHYPLQQYLVDIGNGHLQALNTAWDSRPKEVGGQRWYHLQPNEDITPENPFFWAGHFQNWNGRCAECHSTELIKNYSPADNSYNTTWSDINVACEACHGPGKQHVDLARAGRFEAGYKAEESGLAYVSPEALEWTYAKGDPIANPKGTPTTAHIDMCGGCHSRRSPVQSPNEISGYHDKYRLQALDQGLYFADGQIEDEVYVLGSFLQSKMHAQGVTCMNCHNPHSGKLIAEPNQVCAQCHQPATFDTPQHHLHAKGTEGAQCVNCHMPERTYMGVDDRRDHSFTIPNPRLSIEAGVPNACVGCHQGKDNAWALKALEEAGKKPAEVHWAQLNARTQMLDLLAIQPLAAAVNDPTLAPIIRTTLGEQLANFPSRLALDAAIKALQDPSPLVRRAGVTALAAADPQTRWESLQALFKDPVRSVRFEVAISLADLYPQLPPAQQKQLQSLIDECKQSLDYTADFPSTQVAYASLALRLGEPDTARKHYEQALRIAPSYVPALMNLADFYRAQGVIDKERPLLLKALAAAPESASVQHAVGLHYVRQKNYEQALPYLKAATAESPDSSPRFSYVYAVALDSLGQTKAAIRALQQSDKRWPNQYDTLSTLILYLEKTGNENVALRYLSQLSRIAPSSPQVMQWVQKYQQQQ